MAAAPPPSAPPSLLGGGEPPQTKAPSKVLKMVVQDVVDECLHVKSFFLIPEDVTLDLPPYEAGEIWEACRKEESDA